jgi:hypothetical protein
MTVNLFGVEDALDAEDKKYIKSKQTRERTLRRWGKAEDVLEGANSDQESGSPEEGQTQTSLPES